jgi:NodT family efflux transporter outer membrane factor (OMF) lipoprotein
VTRITPFVAVVLCACTVGPDYQKPDAPVPPAYKELQGWVIAHPQDATGRGAWWSVYNDPVLDGLERQVVVDNQTVKQFEAQYRTAVALVGEARAGLFPTVSLTPDLTRTSGASTRGGSAVINTPSSGIISGGGGGGPRSQFSLEGSVDWSPDVWGRIRRQVESNVAGAQVSAADLANATLSAQAALATDYFDLRAEDSLEQLLRETARAYAEALRILQNQFRAGTIAEGDVATQEAQLENARAQLAGVGVQRAIFEHAIAVLTGHAPAEVTIAPAPLAAQVPVTPPGLPSTLLQRRPDIAAAERQMQEQNALIGVQQAAYYPDISLSAVGGFVASPLSQLFTTPARIWSLGAAASETLYSGGARPAAVEAARATYDASVANYRQAVLTGLQQVEDQLSSLRILEQQERAVATAVAAARHALQVVQNEYNAGTVAYTSVIVQQTTLLGDQQSELAVHQSRLVASVALIAALGGGWDASHLPDAGAIKGANPAYP